MRPLHSLTSTRFFAAIWVVLYHLPRGMGHDLAWVKLVDIGFTAVEFFFVLSGFILAYSYLGRSRPVPAREFWIARLARIYPVYLLALFFAIPFLLGRAIDVGGAGLALRALTTLTMVQSWYPPIALDFNDPSWSVSVEAFFYLLFPLLLPVLARLPKARLVPALASLAIVGAALALAASHFFPGDMLETSDALKWPKFFPPMHLPAFLFGAVLGRLFLERDAKAAPGWRLALLGWGAFAALIAIAFVPGLYLFKHSGGLIAVHGALIWALAHERGPSAWLLARPFLVLLGEASYTLYIIHLPTLRGLAALDATGLGWRVASVLGVVALSIVIHKAFELPMREWVRARFTHLNPRPVA